MKEIPLGWVECSVGECTHTYNNLNGFMPAHHYGDSEEIESFIYGPKASKIYSECWNAYGIIPVKKIPPQKPKTVEGIVKRELVEQDERSSTYRVFIELPWDFPLGKALVTEIMKEEEDGQRNPRMAHS